MSLKAIRMTGVLSTALLGICLAGQPAQAQQQGWPYTGGNPSWEGGRNETYPTEGPEFFPYVPAVTAPAQMSTQIQLEVPATAKVWFDGRLTTQTGAVRTFMVPPLAVGSRYQYAIHVEWQEGTHKEEANRNLAFNAGEAVNLDLTHHAVDAPH